MHASDGSVPLTPPPSPPPVQAGKSRSCQTEIMAGEIQTLQERLELYSNRVHELSQSRASHDKAVSELRRSISQLSAKRTNEISEYEKNMSSLRRENNRIRESLELSQAKLTESNKLMEYYKNLSN